jgi:hypothetical protein
MLRYWRFKKPLFFRNFANLAQIQKLKIGKLVQIVAKGYSNCKNTKKDFSKKPT